MIVLHQDIRSLEYCNRGARIFFQRHNLDWSDFMKNGISFDRLRATGDTMALEAIKRAEQRIAKESK